MKHWIFGGIGLGIGLLAGGAAVYFYLMRQQEELDEDDMVFDIVTEELKRAQSNLEDEEFKVAQFIDAVKMFADENTRDNIFELVSTRMTVRRMQKEGFDEETITNAMIRRQYDDILKQYQFNVDESEETPVVEIEETSEELEDHIEEVERGDGIYVISEGDYVRSDYDHEVLIYYARDDTLATEDDDTVDQSVVGAENLNEFWRSPDAPAIFVRNEKLQIEYEIIWEGATTYVETIGVPSDEAAHAQRIFRKD